ncbi:MAG: NADH-quinone oxidoreductase subunit J [Anaerolineae bacterium]|nr:NADH-quinone oxidoreductase subunit J [Anaerolineae bacterium]
MTTEVLLFIIVGGIAVAAAVMMLLSENAVHSALFLVINFACVAFLYIMLDAPFLAMIQIAVYAGAIMVLFLFVIMLLGAEKLQAPTRQFRWLAPLALALAGGFLLVTGLAITSGQISLTGPVTRAPMLRVVHAAPFAGTVDVYANGQPFAMGVSFGQATTFTSVPAGDYTVELRPEGSSTAALTTTITLPGDNSRAANTFTAIAYGGDASTAPQINLITDNQETVPARTTRITLFNAYTEAVNLVDFGSEGDPSDDRVVVNALQPGTLVELPPVSEDTSVQSWAFTPAAGGAAIFRMNNEEIYSVERETAQLLLLASESTFDDTVRPVALPLVTDAVSSFGGPHAIGELLFTRFMLPFQLIAVLLLAAMIGAIVLTHKEDFRPRRRDVRRRVMKPLAQAISDQVGQDVLRPDAEAPRLPEKQPEPAGD